MEEHNDHTLLLERQREASKDQQESYALLSSIFWQVNRTNRGLLVIGFMVVMMVVMLVAVLKKEAPKAECVCQDVPVMGSADH